MRSSIIQEYVLTANVSVFVVRSLLYLTFGEIPQGTRFLATKEAPVHDKIKEALVKGSETSTMLVMRSVKNTERVFKNPTAIKVAEIEKEKPGDFAAIHPYVKGDNYRKSFHETGDSTSSVWSCGQSIALIDSVPSCAELVESIVGEAESIIRKRLPAMVSKL